MCCGPAKPMDPLLNSNHSMHDNSFASNTKGSSLFLHHRQLLSEVQERLNNVAVLNAHLEYEPNLDMVIAEFVGLNDLRQRIFGP